MVPIIREDHKFMNYEWSNAIIESQQMIFLQMCLFIITYFTNVFENCVFSIDYTFFL